MKIVSVTLVVLLVLASPVLAQSRDEQIESLFGSEMEAERVAKSTLEFAADIWSSTDDEWARREACQLMYDYAGYPRGPFWSLVKSMAGRCLNGQLRRNLDVDELKRNKPANYTPGSAKLFEYCMVEFTEKHRGRPYDRWCASYLNGSTWGP